MSHKPELGEPTSAAPPYGWPKGKAEPRRAEELARKTHRGGIPRDVGGTAAGIAAARPRGGPAKGAGEKEKTHEDEMHIDMPLFFSCHATSFPESAYSGRLAEGKQRDPSGILVATVSLA